MWNTRLLHEHALYAHPWHVLHEYVELAVCSLCAVVGYDSLVSQVLQQLYFCLKRTYLLKLIIVYMISVNVYTCTSTVHVNIHVHADDCKIKALIRNNSHT